MEIQSISLKYGKEIQKHLVAHQKANDSIKPDNRHGTRQYETSNSKWRKGK